jgi:ATP-dependent HslUV protease subunit HslV
MNAVRKLVTSQSSVRAFQGTVRSFHATPKAPTTIVCVRKNGKVCMMGDGMVSQEVSRSNRTLSRSVASCPRVPAETDKANKGTVVGFAGSTAAFTLLERLESKLEVVPVS